jgi:hypothetical protein
MKLVGFTLLSSPFCAAGRSCLKATCNCVRRLRIGDMHLPEGEIARSHD